jgi:hypothetical protein
MSVEGRQRMDGLLHAVSPARSLLEIVDATLERPLQRVGIVVRVRPNCHPHGTTPGPAERYLIVEVLYYQQRATRAYSKKESTPAVNRFGFEQRRYAPRKEVWLPFVNVYRTLCIAPLTDTRGFFEAVRTRNLAA